MQWTLAHRAVGSGSTEHVTIEAETSAAAIELARAQLPEGQQILSIMRVEFGG